MVSLFFTLNFLGTGFTSFIFFLFLFHFRYCFVWLTCGFWVGSEIPVYIFFSYFLKVSFC